MKVLLTSPYYPPHIGGVEFHTMNLARGLAKRGYDIEVITSEGFDNYVKVTTTPTIPFPYSPIPLKFPQFSGDIYHSHVPSPFFAQWVNSKDCKPHVVTYHNDVFVPPKVDGKPIPRHLSRLIEKENLRTVKPVLDNARVIVATTESYAQKSPVLKDYLHKVEVIPNGVWNDDFRAGIDAGEREQIVLYAGRLVEYKGLHILIRAMKNIDARLVVLGDGEDRKDFERVAKLFGVNAEFKGRVSSNEKKEWLRKARVLVLPSISRLEAFGIVMLESMACKTPVIASRIPGVEEVARKGGLTFKDEEDLSSTISTLLENDALASKLGRRGRWIVKKKYDWELILDRTEKLYQRYA
ncbi:MAG: glycosyltransferase family 4 protein [Archaeoglobaceae archaeon]